MNPEAPFPFDEEFLATLPQPPTTEVASHPGALVFHETPYALFFAISVANRTNHSQRPGLCALCERALETDPSFGRDRRGNVFKRHQRAATAPAAGEPALASQLRCWTSIIMGMLARPDTVTRTAPPCQTLRRIRCHAGSRETHDVPGMAVSMDASNTFRILCRWSGATRRTLVCTGTGDNFPGTHISSTLTAATVVGHV